MAGAKFFRFSLSLSPPTPSLPFPLLLSLFFSLPNLWPLPPASYKLCSPNSLGFCFFLIFRQKFQRKPHSSFSSSYFSKMPLMTMPCVILLSRFKFFTYLLSPQKLWLPPIHSSTWSFHPQGIRRFFSPVTQKPERFSFNYLLIFTSVSEGLSQLSKFSYVYLKSEK